MKKFMIAAAIVCVAAMSQAAQVAWANTSSSLLYSIDGTTKLTSTLAKTYAFSIALIDSDGNAVQTLSGASAIGMTAGMVQGATWTYTFDTDATTGDAFSILAKMTVDGKNYEMVIDNSWAIAATDNTGKDVFTWAAGTYGGLSETATVGKWSAAAAPEPTSGLLLLLGVAGLALKRKRA